MFFIHCQLSQKHQCYLEVKLPFKQLKFKHHRNQLIYLRIVALVSQGLLKQQQTKNHKKTEWNRNCLLKVSIYICNFAVFLLTFCLTVLILKAGLCVCAQYSLHTQRCYLYQNFPFSILKMQIIK